MPNIILEFPVFTSGMTDPMPETGLIDDKLYKDIKSLLLPGWGTIDGVVAQNTSDVLDFKSSDGSVTITGTQATKSIDFKVSASAGIKSINGQKVADEILKADIGTGASTTKPTWSTSGSDTNILMFPYFDSTITTTLFGLLQKKDYDAFVAKPTKAYVDDGLALKANTADVYNKADISTLLNLKADKTELANYKIKTAANGKNSTARIDNGTLYIDVEGSGGGTDADTIVWWDKHQSSGNIFGTWAEVYGYINGSKYPVKVIVLNDNSAYAIDIPPGTWNLHDTTFTIPRAYGYPRYKLSMSGNSGKTCMISGNIRFEGMIVQVNNYTEFNNGVKLSFKDCDVSVTYAAGEIKKGKTLTVGIEGECNTTSADLFTVLDGATCNLEYNGKWANLKWFRNDTNSTMNVYRGTLAVGVPPIKMNGGTVNYFYNTTADDIGYTGTGKMAGATNVKEALDS
jgi:hypothetical protein